MGTSAHMQWIKMCIQENAQITHRKQKKNEKKKQSKTKTRRRIRRVERAQLLVSKQKWLRCIDRRATE